MPNTVVHGAGPRLGMDLPRAQGTSFPTSQLASRGGGPYRGSVARRDSEAEMEYWLRLQENFRRQDIARARPRRGDSQDSGRLSEEDLFLLKFQQRQFEADLKNERALALDEEQFSRAQQRKMEQFDDAEQLVNDKFARGEIDEFTRDDFLTQIGAQRAGVKPTRKEREPETPWPDSKGSGQTWEEENFPGYLLTRDDKGNVRELIKPDKTKEVDPEADRRDRLLAAWKELQKERVKTRAGVGGTKKPITGTDIAARARLIEKTETDAFAEALRFEDEALQLEAKEEALRQDPTSAFPQEEFGQMPGFGGLPTQPNLEGLFGEEKPVVQDEVDEIRAVKEEIARELGIEAGSVFEIAIENMPPEDVGRAVGIISDFLSDGRSQEAKRFLKLLIGAR